MWDYWTLFENELILLGGFVILEWDFRVIRWDWGIFRELEMVENKGLFEGASK